MKINDDVLQASNETESIFDGIRNAYDRMLKNQIRANCVIIDRKYIGSLKPFFVACGYDSASCVPPMIGGLKVFFDVLPDDVAFYVMRSENLPKTEIDRLREENEDLKQQIRDVKIALGLDGESDERTAGSRR